MQDSQRMPESALQIKFMEAGSGSGTHGWLHEKTVPYAIVAQATTGSYEVESRLGNVKTTGGEAFLAPANTPLKIKHLSDDGCSRMTFRYFHFQFFVYEAVDVFSLFSLPAKTDAATGAMLGEWIGELVRLSSEPGTIRSMTERNAFAYRILSTLLDASVPVPGAKPAGEDDDNLNAIVAFLRESMSEPLSVNDLLRRFPYSRGALFKLFKRHFRQSPMDFRKTMRLNEAYRRVCATSDTFSSIAERCGFANLQHFSREFKLKFLATPSETRARNASWLNGGDFLSNDTP